MIPDLKNANVKGLEKIARSSSIKGLEKIINEYFMSRNYRIMGDGEVYNKLGKLKTAIVCKSHNAYLFYY